MHNVRSQRAVERGVGGGVEDNWRVLIAWSLDGVTVEHVERCEEFLA
jgi:hypothetical protein